MSAVRRNVARERNEIGLSNFIQSLRSIFIWIQHINVWDVDSKFVETTCSHLENASGSLQLLITNIVRTDDPELNDFGAILKMILSQSRLIYQLLCRIQYSAENIQSCACPSATSQDRGRSAMFIQSRQIQFLRELHFSWKKLHPFWESLKIHYVGGDTN